MEAKLERTTKARLRLLPQGPNARSELTHCGVVRLSFATDGDITLELVRNSGKRVERKVLAFSSEEATAIAQLLRTAAA